MPFVSVIVAKKYYEKLKRKILHKIICNLNYFRKKYNFLVNHCGGQGCPPCDTIVKIFFSSSTLCLVDKLDTMIYGINLL